MNSEKEITSGSLRRTWTIVFGITGVIAVLWLMGTATFMFNVKDIRFVLGDKFSFGVTHNCFTAYAVAAYLASTGTDNLYSPLHYRSASMSSTPIHKTIHRIFHIDEFMYPPPFLIVPYGLWVLFKDFFVMRTAWFVLTLAFVILALVSVAWWCGAFRSQPQLLLFPLLFCAPVVHTTLQIGNVHILIIAISILAMIAFDKQRPLIGGALLGFAIVAKIWPAVLVAYLITQRSWKPVAYCAIAVGVYTLGGVLLFGLNPYLDYFTYGLPRVSSGEAFFYMDKYAPTIIENMSVFGIPHKLYALNLLSSPPVLLSPVIGWSFTVVLGVIVLVTGLRREKGAPDDDNNRLLRVQLWLVLLTLVQLRSPFLPWHYGVISTLLLLVLLAASLKGWKLGVISVAWICLATNMPIDFLPMTENWSIGYTLFATLLMYSALVVSLRNYYVSTKGIYVRPAKGEEG